MPTKQDGIPVCKNCGAVSRGQHPHCAFCGAVLNKDMLLPRRRPLSDVDAARLRRKNSESKEIPVATASPKLDVDKTPKKITVLGMFSLLCGIIAVAVMISSSVFAQGSFIGILALVLGIVNISQKKGGNLTAAVGIGLGAYVLLVNGFWTFVPIFYMF